MRYRIKHVVEYALLRAVAGGVNLLPPRAALALGWGLAAVGHFLLGFRRAEAHRRIRQTLGPDVSARAVRRIAWRSWRNLCFNAVETLRMPRLTRAEVERRLTIPYVEPVQAHLLTGRGAIIAAPHTGNWELVGVASHLRGLPMFFIARRQKNPLTDAYLNRMRGSTGVDTVLNDERVLLGVIRRLRTGMVLAILPDVRSRTPSLAVPFLGGTANLGAGMGLFARAAQVPIFPCAVLREGWMRHRVLPFPPVWPDPGADKEADWRRMTCEVVAHFDAFIRAHPEQYFWYNKRWVLDPLAPPAPDAAAETPPASPEEPAV